MDLCCIYLGHTLFLYEITEDAEEFDKVFTEYDDVVEGWMHFSAAIYPNDIIGNMTKSEEKRI